MTPRALLNRIRCKDAYQSAQPWQIGLDGNLFGFATDGHIAVSIAGDYGFSHGHETLLIAVPPFAGSVRTVSLPAIQTWAGEPTWKKERDPLATWVRRDVIRHGVLFGVPVNRELVARAVSIFNDSEVEVYVGGYRDALGFVAPGWRAAVMPMFFGDPPTVPDDAVAFVEAMAA